MYEGKFVPNRITKTTNKYSVYISLKNYLYRIIICYKKTSHKLSNAKEKYHF